MSLSVQNALVAQLGELLLDRGLRLSAAESCTGGMLGEWITAVPGSSAYFLGGVISYDDSIKTHVLGVSPQTIVAHGAVSAECALEMAHGIRKLVSSGIAVSITGVAGPGGGTVAKPVGTTFIAVVTPESEHVEKFSWPYNRQENREHSAQAALNMIITFLVGEKKA